MQYKRMGMGLMALGLAGLAGTVVGILMPYGPATAGQALAVMALGAAVGLAGGALLRTRWAGVILPLAHILSIEVVRVGAVGPTVDAIRFDSVWGVLAFALGRGFHGLVGLLPMFVGALAGALWARGARKAGPWVPVGVLGAALLALAVGIALPASTPPVLGTDGQPLPGSIAEMVEVRIGGVDQTISIHGGGADKPILLYLSGGPGQSSLPYPRVLFQELQRDFIFVGWDQRGTGKSYAGLSNALTPEVAVADVVELTEYLCERFDERKIYLLGESYGTLLGVLTVQARPDLYYALLSSGQMVNVKETDRRLYQDMLDLAERTHNPELAATMRGFGEPPYADPLAYAMVMGYYNQLYKPYQPPAAYIARGNTENLGPMGVLGREYNLVERVNVLRGLMDMFSILYPQLQGVDFRRDATQLDVPVYIFDGQAELSARRDLAVEWYALLQAPHKEWISYENAAHSVVFEQFEDFQRQLVENILPETYQK